MYCIIGVSVIAGMSFYYAKDRFLSEVTLITSQARKILLKPRERASTTAPASIQTASLQMAPAEGEYLFDNSEHQTAIKLQTKNRKAAGADIRLLYNQDFVEVVKVTPSLSISAVPLNATDAKEGTVSLSFLAPAGEALEGEREIAVIFWKTKREGEARISFDFTPGATNDTNIAEFGTGKDILTSVANARYSISL